MIITAGRQRLDEQLASVEEQVGAARRILSEGLPCDRLLRAIGAAQATLDQVAGAVPGLCGARCQIRLTPDEFSAEFDQTFGLQVRAARTWSAHR
jgi:hypothetical protein